MLLSTVCYKLYCSVLQKSSIAKENVTVMNAA